jgi:hypothetical protein
VTMRDCMDDNDDDDDDDDDDDCVSCWGWVVLVLAFELAIEP